MCSGESQPVPSLQGHVVATNHGRGALADVSHAKTKTKQKIIEIIQADETLKTVQLCFVCCLLGFGTRAPVSGRAPCRQGGGTVEAPIPASSTRHPASGTRRWWPPSHKLKQRCLVSPCRKDESTGYYPSMYLQRSGEPNTPEKSELRNRSVPPRR